MSNFIPYKYAHSPGFNQGLSKLPGLSPELVSKISTMNPVMSSGQSPNAPGTSTFSGVSPLPVIPRIPQADPMQMLRLKKLLNIDSNGT